VRFPLRRVRLGDLLAVGSGALSAMTLFGAALGGGRSWAWILVVGGVAALPPCLLLALWRSAPAQLYISAAEKRLRPFILLLGVSVLVTTRALLSTSFWYLPAGCAALFVTVFLAHSIVAMRRARWIQRAVAGHVAGVCAHAIADSDGSRARLEFVKERAYRARPHFFAVVPTRPWRALVRARGIWSALVVAMIALGVGLANKARLPSVIRAYESSGAKIRRLPDDPHIPGASLWEVRDPSREGAPSGRMDAKPVANARRLYVDEKTGAELSGVELFLRYDESDPSTLADEALSALFDQSPPYELCSPRSHVGSMIRDASVPARIEGSHLLFRIIEMTGPYPSFSVSDVNVDLRTGQLTKEPMDSFVVSMGLPACHDDVSRE
jgi:hypothetical protein